MLQKTSYSLVLDITFSFRTIFRMFLNRIIHPHKMCMTITLPIIVDNTRMLYLTNRPLYMQLAGGSETRPNTQTHRMLHTCGSIIIEMLTRV